MIAVAVIAVAFPAGKAGERLIRLSYRYRQTALLNARNETTFRALVAKQEAQSRVAKDGWTSEAYRESAAVYARHAETFSKLRHIYHRAAWRPWEKSQRQLKGEAQLFIRP